MWLLVPACAVDGGPTEDSTPREGSASGDTPTQSGTWDADVIITADELEVFVSLDPPLRLYWTTLADLDADGIADLMAVTDDPTDAKNIDVEVVVLGPLDDVHLPADAWISIHEDFYTEWISPIELTGDAAIDVVMWNAYPKAWLHPSPYDGSTPPGSGWIDIATDVLQNWTWVLDVDGDGTADRIASRWTDYIERLEITRGPHERFSGLPDVTVTPMCRGEVNDDPYDAAVYHSAPAGDIDGDGSPELSITSYSWAKYVGDCGGFTVSLPESGTIDPFSSPLAVDGVTAMGLTAAGDWNGDGLSELWNASSGTLLVSPITLTSSGVVGADAREASPAIVTMTPVPVDSNGDGRAEVLVSLNSNVLALLPPDLDRLADVHVETAWDVGVMWPGVYADRGHAYVAINEGDSMRRIDLGELVARERPPWQR